MDFGFLPVAVTIIGSRGHGALPLRKLAPSLALGLAGIACVAWQSLGNGAGGSSAGGFGDGVIGFFCALAALVSWTTYAVGNSRWLGRLQAISAHDWNLLIGVVTVALVFLIGCGLGLLVGFKGGWWDTIIMRITDAQLSIPMIILAITILGVTKPEVHTIIIVLALSGWPLYARVARSAAIARTSCPTASRGYPPADRPDRGS